jgi:phage gpG-like protein
VPIDIDVRVSGAKEASARLIAMHARTKLFTPVLVKAKQQVKLANAANFATNGLPVGGWQPLDAQYAAWKMARFPGAPPLVRSGRLFASLTGATASLETMTNTSFTIGTTVEYAKFHQYGTTKMPKRKIVFEPPLFAKKLGVDALDWIARGEVL